jgi:serralysin
LTYSSPETAIAGALNHLKFDVSDGVNHTLLDAQVTVDAAISTTYNGTAGNDRLDGAGGNDVIDGKAGADTMIGGSGNDTLIVDNAGDTADEVGGSGVDLVQSSITFSLAGAHALGSIEKLLLTGSSAVNGYGNGFANTLTGNSAANVLSGGGSNDTLAGLGGNDKLWGGAGNDVLSGGTGKDTLSGGTGNDVFLFNTAPGSSNVDKIVAFHNDAGNNDSIKLDHTVFAGLGAVGHLVASRFFAGTAAHDADDRVIYDQTSGGLFYDSDGSGSHGMVEIAVLTTKPALSAGDFFG